MQAIQIYAVNSYCIEKIYCMRDEILFNSKNEYKCSLHVGKKYSKNDIRCGTLLYISTANISTLLHYGALTEVTI